MIKKIFGSNWVLNFFFWHLLGAFLEPISFFLNLHYLSNEGSNIFGNLDYLTIFCSVYRAPVARGNVKNVATEKKCHKSYF